MGDIADLFDNEDATGVAAAVNAGAVTPVELMEEAIARLEERNPQINAVIADRAEEALADAAAVDKSLPFAGVPFVVKDLGAEVAGMPATRGSRLWADHVAQEDSELVRRYKAAGFVVLGTTNSPEMGKSASTEPLLYGPTRNPYDLTRSAGGSSGGTAAAVAAGIVPIGHGNDGGGSIRIPASACGLVGLKPSRSRTPAAPSLSLLSYPMGVSHVLARSVRDSARVLDLTAGPMQGDAYQIDAIGAPWADQVGASPGPLKVAFSTINRQGETVHPDCEKAVRDTAALLESLGHEVSHDEPDYPLDAFNFVMKTVMGVATAVAVDRRLEELGRALRDDDIEPFTRMMYDRAGEASGVEVLIAMEEVERAGLEVGKFFAGYDLLLTSTMPLPPPPLGLLDTSDPATMAKNAGQYASLTSPFNTTGQPAISLPLATDSGGVPIGMQLVANFGREDLLVAVASQIERARPWSIAPAWPVTGAG
jgi:amidase